MGTVLATIVIVCLVILCAMLIRIVLNIRQDRAEARAEAQRYIDHLKLQILATLPCEPPGLRTAEEIRLLADIHELPETEQALKQLVTEDRLYSRFSQSRQIWFYDLAKKRGN